MSDSDASAPNEVTLFRAAVQSLRDCLNILKEPPGLSDKLCNGFLEIVEGPNPEGELKQFRELSKRIANGDIYLTALLKALDNAKSEGDARLWVIRSVNEQMLRELENC